MTAPRQFKQLGTWTCTSGSRHLQQYITERRKQGIKNSTINRELSLLRRAFNLGLRAEPPKVNKTPRIPKLREDNVRKGFFERAEYEALRKALPDHLEPVLTFAYYTGTRRGEILSLRWSQVDLDHRIIRLEPGETKNKDARAIPLTTELATVLQALHDQRDLRCSWVFPYDGKRFTRFEASWAKACTAAGLITPDGKPAKLLHDPRRTGVRNLVRAGVTELIAMRITGHRTRSVFDRYNIISEGDLRRAALQLENFFEHNR